MVAVHHATPCYQVSLTTVLQAVAARVDFGYTKLTVCSLYLPPDGNLNLNDLRVIPRQIAQKRSLLGPTPFDFLEIWWADSTHEVMHFHSFLALGDLRGQF